jgi:hypothetical protein
LILGTDLNRTDEFGFTPLLWACANGQLITTKYLLDLNVDLGIVGNHGENALLFSSCFGYSDIVKLLLQLGMNVNFTDEVNITKEFRRRPFVPKDICFPVQKSVSPGIFSLLEGKCSTLNFIHVIILQCTVFAR